MADRIAQLQALLANEPNDAFCLYGLAMEYAKAGRAAEAIGAFDRVIAVDPGYCYAYFHKAKTLEEQGDVSAAQTTLRQGLAQARCVGDAQAVNEIAGYLDEIS